MRYESFGADKEEIHEVFSGFTSWLKKMVDAAEVTAGQAEMSVYVNRYEQQLMRLAGRYQDTNGEPIDKNSLDKLPARALYLFLHSVMKLPDEEIANVLKSVNSNQRILVTMRRTRPATVVELKKNGATIGSVWAKPLAMQSAAVHARLCETLLNVIVAAAALRKMELDEFEDRQEQPAPAANNGQPTPNPLVPGSNAPGNNPPAGAPPAAPTASLNAGWTNGQPINLSDGSVIQPNDAPYAPLAAILTRAQQAGLL